MVMKPLKAPMSSRFVAFDDVALHRTQRALVRQQVRAELPQRADAAVGELWRRVEARTSRAIEPRCQRLDDVILVASDLGPEGRYIGALITPIEPASRALFQPKAGDSCVSAPATRPASAR
jgi:hypothetical protein